LIEAGAKVAIASDFNPGSSAVADPYFVMHLAARYLKMSPYEILTAFTLNAAAVLGIADTCGTVEPGKNADMICFKDADLLTLPYMIGIKPVEIIKKGRRFAN
ncbi:MAG: imidazolonepropionase, partial [Thermotogae bacterium]